MRTLSLKHNVRQIGRRMTDSPSTVDHAVTVLVIAHLLSAK